MSELWRPEAVDAALRGELRGALAKKGFTQRAVASALGVTQPTVSKWLTGESPITTMQLLEVLGVIGMPWDALAKIAKAATEEAHRNGG